MVRVYAIEAGMLRPIAESVGAALPDEAVWIDLVAPSPEEAAAVERALGLVLPSLEAVSGIQPSDRLVERQGSLFGTALVPAGDDATAPIVPLTFIRAGGRLVTLGYGPHHPLASLVADGRLGDAEISDARALFAALIEGLVDRIADRLEAVGQELDRLGRATFRHAGAAARRAGRRLSIRQRTARLEDVILGLGTERELAARLRECLHSLLRLVTFAAEHAEDGQKHRLEAIALDLRTVAEYDSYLTGDMEFMLDATVGLIEIQQNKVIYLLSIVGVVLTPPVLVASTYGMNFKVMPELSWPWGYAWALGLMLVSAVGPFLLFKARGWL